MPNFFISYRRADSRKDANRIADRLIAAFGRENVFKDVDNIPIGADFRDVVTQEINRSDVVLVVIGSQWSVIKDEQGNRRLDNASDTVRIEVEIALSRLKNKSCLVIPVLVDNAKMPTDKELPPSMGQLAFLNAVTVRDDPDFNDDTAKLVTGIRKVFRTGTQSSARNDTPRNMVIAVTVVAIISLLGLVVLPQISNSQSQSQQTETAVAHLLLNASTASAVAKVPTNTVMSTPSSTFTPTATDTIMPTLTSTNTSTVSPTPTDMPTTTVLSTLIAPAPTSILVATSAPTINSTSKLANNMPCSAIVIDPDPKNPSTIVTALYNAVSDTTKSGEFVRVGDSVTIQRLQYDAKQIPYYLIYNGVARLGWISSNYLKLEQTCTR